MDAHADAHVDAHADAHVDAHADAAASSPRVCCRPRTDREEPRLARGYGEKVRKYVRSICIYISTT